jgi:hypothetical protein
MRHSAVFVAVCALLAGCGGSEELESARESATSSSAATKTTSAAPSSAAATTSAAPTTEPLSTGDTYICTALVAPAGDAHEWLTTLERDGTISGDVSTPGYIEVYQLGGAVSAVSDPESPRLATAAAAVEREGLALRAAIDSQGTVSPSPLRQALDDTAEVCEDGGITIAWNR